MRRSLTPLLLIVATLLMIHSWAQDASRALTAKEARASADAGKSFPNAILSGLDLAALRTQGLDLSGTDWTRCDLRGASFEATNLKGARLDEVNARGSEFIDCNLSNAALRHADFSGALFRRVQLAGADLAGSVLRGAIFDGVTYSQTGGAHSGAVAAALGALSTGEAAAGGGGGVTPTLASGLTGEPFAFVYDTASPGAWPMSPFTESPIRAAAATVGADVKSHYDMAPAAAVQLLTKSLSAGKVAVLPLSLRGEEMSGPDFEQAFWGAAVALNDMEKPARIVVLVPPFGRREYLPNDLGERWTGPWPTLEAAGAERSQARCPCLIIERAANPRAPRDVVVAALQHAIALANEPRTYTTLVPGLAGFKRLALDLRTAAAPTADQASMATLAAWAGRPRSLLISARTAAAAFLEEAAGQMLQADRPALTRAAALYRGEAEVLARNFPDLVTGASRGVDAWKAQFADAAGVVDELTRIEMAAIEALGEVPPSAQ